MNSKLKLPILAAALLAAAFATGCMNVTKIKYDDAPRVAVRFATPQAEQTFYDAILAEHFPTDGYHGSLTLFVSPPFWINHRTRQSSNVIFNAAAAEADLNHDAVITEDEADAFAAKTAMRNENTKLAASR